MEPFRYSALIFDPHQNEPNAFPHLQNAIQLFNKDDRCAQIVLSCKSDWLLSLSYEPFKKTTMVQMASHPYVSMVSALKAISEENVLIVGLAESISQEQIDQVIQALKKYPAIYCSPDLQGFDTRLLMFCLQHTIERNLEITNYAQAVSNYGDTPLQYLARNA